MATRINPLYAMAAPRDFTDRLPAGVYDADERMVVQPTVDPGYAMTNVYEGNLNQSPGQIVGGYLKAGGADPYDFSARYNTQLSPEDEARFQQWLQASGRSRDLYDYDLRGAFQSGAATAPNGHLPDTYKKPNHPTFSSQSQYSGREGYIGGAWQQDANGAWTFQPGPTNMMSRDALQQYFQRAEPGNRLLYPKAYE